jgi:hypothetical protein
VHDLIFLAPVTAAYFVLPAVALAASKHLRELRE